MKPKSLQHGTPTVALAFFFPLMIAGLTGCAGSAGRDMVKNDAVEGTGGDMPMDGMWRGEIVVLGQALEITVNFLNGDKPSGTIDIPAQGAKNLPLADIRFGGDSVYFELPSSGIAVFDGKLENGVIAGAFRQSGFEGTFRLAGRTAASIAGDRLSGDEAAPAGSGAAVLEKPTVNPMPASRFREETVSVRVDGGSLAGTLMFPDSPATDTGKIPVALIIAGSGPTDRNGNNPLIPGRNDSLKLLAEALSAGGIASLRYDKRGLAESVFPGFEEEKLTFDDYISDAVTLVDFLARDGRFGKTALIGHSEGSLIALVAAGRTDVSAVVSIAGMGKRYQEILLGQLSSLPGDLLEESRSIIRKLENGERVPSVNDALLAIFRPSVQPFLISVFRLDPRMEIAGLDIPVLIVQGTADIQVPVESAELLHGAKKGSVLAVIVNMNHVMKTVTGGREANIAAYSDPGLPLAEDFGEAVISFLSESVF